MKTIIKRFLILCLLCLALPVWPTVQAAEEEVTLISTPQELDAIRQDLDGHYKLAGNIDMAGFYDFEPIGNEVDGAFTGTLDGGGYTISNLELRYDGYKYVGLFGYLDGTVTDLTLESIVVEAGRYGGGLAGYADGNSRIEGITVSGSVKAYSQYFADYAGGIVGYAVCDVSGCVNRAEIIGWNNAGGIAGYAGDVTGCTNYGEISHSTQSGFAYAGGIAAHAADVTDCINYGQVSSWCYTAGIAYSATGNISGCNNYGSVNSSSYSAAGVTYNCGGTITDCSNLGNITVSDNGYGIGQAYAIKNCISRAQIKSTNNSNSYKVCGIGTSTTVIENCVATGSLNGPSFPYAYGIGTASKVTDSYTVLTHSGISNNWLITNGSAEGCMAVVLNECRYASYTLPIRDGNLCIYRTASSLYLGDQSLYTVPLEQIVRSYDNLDYELTWTRDENWSSGLPIPANLPEYLELSDIVLILDQKESAQLKARVGTAEVTDLTWASADTSIATVDQTGKVTAWGTYGQQTVISATTDEGLRMDCLVIISDNQPTGVTVSPSSEQKLRVGQTLQLSAQVSVLSEKGQPTTLTWTSSDEAVATVDQNGLVTAQGYGSANITVSTSNGKTASCKVTVCYAGELEVETESVIVAYGYPARVAYALKPAGAMDPVSVSVSKTIVSASRGDGYVEISTNYTLLNDTDSYQTVTLRTTGGLSKTIQVTLVSHSIPGTRSVNIGKTTQLTVTRYPTNLEQRFTWTSSDDSIATVDENGIVTGHRPGVATITARSEHGYASSCTVTVTNYANEVHTDRSDIHLLKGSYDQVNAWMIPLNCTSGLTYASSNTNAVTVDAAGKLYAKGTGSSQITVTASGTGVKTTFSVTVVAAAVPAADLELSAEQLTMRAGEVSFLTAAVAPADTTDSRVTWSSSDENVVTVTAGGVVTAKSGGSAIITAALSNGLSRTCIVNVRSNEQMDISAATVIAVPGETIQIPFAMVRNPGTAAMRLKISYDSELLTAGTLTTGAMLDGVTLTGSHGMDGSYYVLWSSPTDIEETGTMFTLSFTVSENAAMDTDAQVSISYEPGDIVDAEHVELLPGITNGLVRIRALLPGDVYEDRILNSHDILLLQQHLTELVDFTAHQTYLGDLNQDGRITMQDLVCLAQTLVTPMSAAADPTTDADSGPFMVTVGSAVPGSDGSLVLPVAFSGCPDISAFKFHVSYDAEAYTLTAIEGCTGTVSASLMANLETPGNAVVTWYSNRGTRLNGNVFLLHFCAVGDAAPASAEVVLSCDSGDLCSSALEPLDPFLVPGQISIPTTVATGWSGAAQWTLTDDGVLTVYGEGNMKNYGYSGGQPWLNKGVEVTSVVIEEGVTGVGSGAFMNLTTLKSVVLPETLTKMGEAAFYGSGLTAVEIPASLWTIQPYTFKNCANLTSVKFNEGNLQKISDGAFYGTGLTELVLPDCLDILDVYAFKGCADLTSITIGSGLTELREAVFYGTAIPTITVPEGITKIGPYAFKNCVALETIDLPESLTSVGEASFYACTALKTVELPDAVKSIGSYAFRKCAAIEELTFGSELTTIGECAFYGCTSLTEIVIPDKVTTIKPYAFKTCTGLTSVTLGSSVATIGEGAFNTCTGLKTIVFPASVTTIGNYAFSGSYNLWKLTFEGNAPAIGTGAFKGLNATAYYPTGNSTWTDSVRQNYGGSITWKAQ